MSSPVFSPERTSGLEGVPVPEGRAFLSEMFSGIQGEGPFIGVRQVFVRFGGCDLRCWWCDTPESLVRRGPGRFERVAGSREFESRNNPLPLEAACALLGRLDPELHHSVTFTGGEPLLQPDAVVHLSRWARTRKATLYLETHGARVRELGEVIDHVDIVSMDVKLPSSSGELIDLGIHREFLQLASSVEVFVKVVVTPETDDSEVLSVAEMVAETNRDAPLIIQPVTPAGRVKVPPSPDQVLRLQSLCLGVHPDVRVIPQVHKLMGQL